jgi:hypothetical protein
MLVCCLSPLPSLRNRVCTALGRMFEAVGKSANFPKIFNTRKYPAAILQRGSVNYANTAGREAVIKPLRDCWEHTNKQPRTLRQQVAHQVQVFESLGAVSRQTAGAQPPHQPHGVVSMEACGLGNCCRGVLVGSCPASKQGPC